MIETEKQDNIPWSYTYDDVLRDLVVEHHTYGKLKTFFQAFLHKRGFNSFANVSKYGRMYLRKDFLCLAKEVLDEV